MADALDRRILVHQAERGLNQWLAEHGTSLSSEAFSPEAQGMTINLLRIGAAMKTQLHALAEQFAQDTWEERLARGCDDD
jgi:hypothetical protein